MGNLQPHTALFRRGALAGSMVAGDGTDPPADAAFFNAGRRQPPSRTIARFALPDASSNITQLLAAVQQGEPGAFESLIPLVYEELCGIARQNLNRRRHPNQTLHTTALVHEAYLRLADTPNHSWNDRLHFYAVAAKAMRSVLVDRARRRNAAKRDGGRLPLPLDEALAVFDDHQLDILALDHAMASLSQQDERKCKVVEMRFFAGMTNAEIATALGISEPTVERDWRMARAYFARELGEHHAGGLLDAEGAQS